MTGTTVRRGSRESVTAISPLLTTTPSLSITELLNPDTEYSITLPACAGFEVKARNDIALRYAFETGKVAGPTDPYAVLPAGSMLFYPEAVEAGTMLYLASGVASTTVEVVAYVVS